MATDAVKLYCQFGGEHNLKEKLLKAPGNCPILARQTHYIACIRSCKLCRPLGLRSVL